MVWVAEMIWLKKPDGMILIRLEFGWDHSLISKIIISIIMSTINLLLYQTWIVGQNTIFYKFEQKYNAQFEKP